MKKLLAILAIILASCSSQPTTAENKTYTLKYVVFYPNYYDTVTVSTIYEFEWSSYEGTNTITEYGIGYRRNVYNSTAPYKILSYTVK
jgi:hypoxanthine phosphoribosyltransferase